jgi:outer membrane murein-binding lipoprotein Lpp
MKIITAMKKMFFVLFVILFGCVSRSEYDTLSEQNKILQEKVSSLETELEGYRNNPVKLLQEAENAFKEGKLVDMEEVQSKLIKYHPQSDARKKVDQLIDRYNKIQAQKEASKPKEYAVVTTIADGYDSKRVNLWDDPTDRKKIVDFCTNNERVEVVYRMSGCVKLKKKNGNEGWCLEGWLK